MLGIDQRADNRREVGTGAPEGKIGQYLTEQAGWQGVTHLRNNPEKVAALTQAVGIVGTQVKPGPGPVQRVNNVDGMGPGGIRRGWGARLGPAGRKPQTDTPNESQYLANKLLTGDLH
ncbi:hypothetical protein GCM10027578_36520 [Spirosoma luteolum]